MSGYRPDYTRTEQTKMLDYILENDGVLQLRGNVFWKDMAESGLFQRTWQSMKEHFRKHIFPNLHLFKLAEDDYTRIKEGYVSTAGRRKVTQPAPPEFDMGPLVFTDSDEEKEVS